MGTTGLFSPLHLIILLIVLLLLFGAKRLPEIGRSLGTGMREFKDSVTMSPDKNAATTSELPPPVATAPVASAPVAAAPVPAAPVPSEPPAAPAEPAPAPAEPAAAPAEPAAAAPAPASPEAEREAEPVA